MRCALHFSDAEILLPRGERGRVRIGPLLLGGMGGENGATLTAMQLPRCGAVDLAVLMTREGDPS